MRIKILALVQIINQLKYILDDKQKKKAVLVFFITTLGSFFEMLSITALLPFIQSIIDLNSVKNKWYGNYISKYLKIEDPFMILIVLGILIVGVYLIKNLYLIWSLKSQIKFKYNIVNELSVKIFNSYMKRPYSFFLNLNSSEFMRAVNDDIRSISIILEQFSRIIRSLITLLLLGMYIFVNDAIMATGVLVLSGISILSIQFLFGSKIKELGSSMRIANKEQYQSAYQAISGIKDIKVMQRSEYFIFEYRRANANKNIADSNYYIINEMPPKMIEVLCVCGLVITLCIRIKIGNNMADFVPKLATFALAIFQMIPLASTIASNLNMISLRKEALDVSYNSLKEVNEYEKEKKIRNGIKDEEKYFFTRKIQINNIKWIYAGSKKIILDHVNITINKGEAVAFIGTSGAGKTTLADIILGLLEPEQGQVLMDGIDVFSIPKKWSETIGYVPQSVFLLDDTIRNNVVFGKIDAKVDDQKVWDALEEAQLKEHVMSLPDKLDTKVGERGVKLSGGQRQRVAIARALYYNPDILVLDEATSALDNETEQAVMEAIDSLHGSKTLIIVAHRLSTIKNCDRIYEIENGIAVERSKEDVCK